MQCYRDWLLKRAFNLVPPRRGLTVRSSRHQQAPLVGSLRASHSGAAYLGR